MNNATKVQEAITEKITFLEKLSKDCGLGRTAEDVLREFKKLQAIIDGEQN
jgi:hypothetical protein